MPDHPTSLGSRDRRLSPRRNTSIQATISYNGGRTQVPCVIRNVSEGGAKLEVASVRAIPSSFDLLIPGMRTHPCRVAWRTLKEIGVAYEV